VKMLLYSPGQETVVLTTNRPDVLDVLMLPVRLPAEIARRDYEQMVPSIPVRRFRRALWCKPTDEVQIYDEILETAAR